MTDISRTTTYQTLSALFQEGHAMNISTFISPDGSSNQTDSKTKKKRERHTDKHTEYIHTK